MNIVTLRKKCFYQLVMLIIIAMLLILVLVCFFIPSQNQVEGDIKENTLDVRDVIVPPVAWNIPYNLQDKEKVHFSQFKQDELVAKIFNNKVHGFFMEAGAYDGEELSNTLYLEKTLNWTGLLIEPVPTTYSTLVGKNRKAHLINACISPDGKEEALPLVILENRTYVGGNEESGGIGQIEGGPDMPEIYDFAREVKAKGYNKVEKKTYNIPCYPLESMLDAIGSPVIDYFSLDVEGFEMSILKSIPWEKIKIKLIGIEINHVPEGKLAVKTFMEKQGFKFYRRVEIDYFFYKPDLFTDINLSQVDQLDL